MKQLSISLVVTRRDSRIIDTTGESIEYVVRHIPITRRPALPYRPPVRAFARLQRWILGVDRVGGISR